MAQALLLNATYEPLHLVSARHAVLLVLCQKAEVVEESGEVLRSERATIPVPSVIRLVRLVRIPYRSTLESRAFVLDVDVGVLALRVEYELTDRRPSQA